MKLLSDSLDNMYFCTTCKIIHTLHLKMKANTPAPSVSLDRTLPALLDVC